MVPTDRISVGVGAARLRPGRVGLIGLLLLRLVATIPLLRHEFKSVTLRCECVVPAQRRKAGPGG